MWNPRCTGLAKVYGAAPAVALRRLVNLRNAVRNLATEKRRLYRMLIEPTFMNMEVDVAAKRIGITTKHWACRVLAASFADSLVDEDGREAPNFVELEMLHPTHGSLLVTIRKRWGKQPSEMLTEAQAEIARLQGEVEQLTSSRTEYMRLAARMAERIGAIHDQHEEPNIA